MSFQTCKSFFPMLSTKEDILKNFKEPNSCWSPLTSIVGKSMGTFNSLVTSILQNIFSYVQYKKVTHTGLERGWVNDDTILILGWNIPLRFKKYHTTYTHAKYWNLCQYILKSTKILICIHERHLIWKSWTISIVLCIIYENTKLQYSL